ncbi:DUF177 domain-containing protein [bacterium]|nr:DUF177 domain-containing protein [bacterium]
MRIFIYEIRKEGLDIKADLQKDPWLKGAISEALGGRCDESAKVELNIHISRVDSNVTLRGKLHFETNLTCDRCLEECTWSAEIPIDHTLAPLYENRRQKEIQLREDVELVKEDLGFEFYEGDSFELSDIVRESFALAQPLKYLCKDACKGLCPKCGANLNEKTCSCADNDSSLN